MSKKILIILVGLLVYLASAFTSYSFFKGGAKGEEMINPLVAYKPPVRGKVDKAPAVNNEPKTEECPLNGQLLTKSQRLQWEKRRPLGIMIENHKEARPQSGLSRADVVFEAVAEGGITRFLAVYYCQDASYVGPVRSARVYFVKLMDEFGDYPLYAHVGGANTPGPADALGMIDDWGWSSYNDMNQFSVPFPNFWRDYERLSGRATEHTVYTSTIKLWKYAADRRRLTNVDRKGKEWNDNFIGWKFIDDQPTKTDVVNKVSFGFWSHFADQYAVVWDYDQPNNNYRRSNGGEPHLDKDTGKQLTAKNVVVLFMKERPANDGYHGGHIIYKTTGKGKALMFHNGRAIEGVWKRPKKTSLMRVYTPGGKEISMVRGKIFFEILPRGNKVSY